VYDKGDSIAAIACKMLYSSFTRPKKILCNCQILTLARDGCEDLQVFGVRVIFTS